MNKIVTMWNMAVIFTSLSKVKGHFYVDTWFPVESFWKYKHRVGVISQIVCVWVKFSGWNNELHCCIIYLKMNNTAHMCEEVRQLQTKDWDKPQSYELIW